MLPRFGLAPAEYQFLWDHLRQPDILQSIGAGTRHRAILDELLTSTWFSVAGDQQIVATEAGSRPGDNLADVVFAFMYSRLSAHLREGLAAEGCKTSRDDLLPESLKPLELQDVSPQGAPQLCDLTCAHDLAIFLQHESPQELGRRTQLTAGLLFDLCWRRGLLPNFKKGKTEPILKLKGLQSKQLRLQIYGMSEPSLAIPSALRKDVRLRLVHKYRHLGHQVPFSFKQHDEIRSRVAQARTAYVKHRRGIFQNADLPLALRTRLLNCLVISKLLFNQGTWVELSVGSLRRCRHQSLQGTAPARIRTGRTAELVARSHISTCPTAWSPGTPAYFQTAICWVIAAAPNP